jgi:hypothetical protein
MIEQVPLAVELHNGMMRGPANNRFKNLSPVSKRAIRIIAYGITDKMCITG